MSILRNKITKKWDIKYRYTTWNGESKQSTKRGFDTKREAETWLFDFKNKKTSNLGMRFLDFIQIYLEDIETRIRANTMRNKLYMINLKILPYFKNKNLDDIKPRDIRTWQNQLIKEGYAPTYLRTLHTQLSCIFNYAVKYYDLNENPCLKAGSIGKKNADLTAFWTKQEFTCFIETLIEKPQHYTIFTLLFWTGMRIGEALALTKKDIDIENRTISINKSYQRIDKKDIITLPKTPKSKRLISIPSFLSDILDEYIHSLYGRADNERIFLLSKSNLQKTLASCSKKVGLESIRIHDLRHSHTAHLIEIGFSVLAIAERLGHDRVETTMNIYAHLYPNKQQQLADKLDLEFQEENIDE